jgi:hypothetical protein
LAFLFPENRTLKRQVKKPEKTSEEARRGRLNLSSIEIHVTTSSDTDDKACSFFATSKIFGSNQSRLKKHLTHSMTS